MDTNKQNLSTSNFKNGLGRFLQKVFSLILFFLIIFAVVIPEYEESYAASLIDKMNRLESIDNPKIVLIGNSNLAYGIDSKLIEQSLGMPVVNMGFHGATGNAFSEEMAKINVTPGDIYIICHTTFANDDEYENPVTVWTALENHFSLYRLIRKSDIPVLLKAFPAYFKNCLTHYVEKRNGTDEADTSRTLFNIYGDIDIYRENGHFEFDGEIKPPLIDEISMNRINELNQYLVDKKATLLVASYPILYYDKTEDKSVFREFGKELQQKLDCPVISDYDDYFFDISLFYDTRYHLSTEGAQKRTEQLISDLKNWGL